MMEAPMKITMDYAQASETLKTSLKLKGSPVAVGFATTADEIPPGMPEIDKTIKHCMMVEPCQERRENLLCHCREARVQWRCLGLGT